MKEKEGLLKVEVVFIPSQAKKWRDKVCIVVDVLRASSTAVTLLDLGCAPIYPIRGLEAARKLAREQGCIKVGERRGFRVPDFDFGNSPTRLLRGELGRKPVVFSTSNGTAVLNNLKDSPLVLMGCFLNARACCQAAIDEARRRQLEVGIVCAGSKGEVVLDDAICVGYLADVTRELAERDGQFVTLTDAAKAAVQVYRSFPDIETGFRQSSSGNTCVEIGDSEDVPYCSQVDISQTIPVFIPGKPPRIQAWRQDINSATAPGKD